MNSCLYELNIMHNRLKPKQHKFTHRIFMFYLDLDEVDHFKLPLFSRNCFNVFNFADADHVQPTASDTKEKISDFVKKNGVDLAGGKIMLLTNVRVLGYIFNPVAFYFCFDAQGNPVCVVPEISNTFREMKLFWIGPEHLHGDQFRSRQKKHFYISPFVDLDVMLDFRLNVPGGHLQIFIDDFKGEDRFLLTSMTGKRKELNTPNLLRYMFSFPFITLQVIGLIHLHAAILHFIKRIPYHRKENNQHLQQEVLRVWRKN